MEQLPAVTLGLRSDQAASSRSWPSCNAYPPSHPVKELRWEREAPAVCWAMLQTWMQA